MIVSCFLKIGTNERLSIRNKMQITKKEIFFKISGFTFKKIGVGIKNFSRCDSLLLKMRRS